MNRRNFLAMFLALVPVKQKPFNSDDPQVKRMKGIFKELEHHRFAKGGITMWDGEIIPFERMGEFVKRLRN